MLLLSIFYRLLRYLLGLVAVLVRRDLRKDAELLVLRHENTVLRRQVARVRYTPADRVWLAALSRLVSRHRWAEVFPVTPATILTWHRRLVARRWDYTACRRSGRPPTAAAIKNLPQTRRAVLASDHQRGGLRLRPAIPSGAQTAQELRARHASTRGRKGTASGYSLTAVRTAERQLATQAETASRRWPAWASARAKP